MARQQHSYVRPLVAAIADGATTPDPGQVNALVLSATTGGLLRWTGIAWAALADPSRVAKSGDTMTGGLTISAGGLGVTGTTNLGALSVGAVTGSSSVQLVRAGAGDATYLANVSGDTQYRLRVNADGKLTWGPGNATQDTNLYRHAADTLKTDDALVVGGALTAGRILVNVYVDATARDAAVTSPAAGTVVYVTGVGFQVHTGSAWSTIGPSAGGGGNAVQAEVDFGAPTGAENHMARATVAAAWAAADSVLVAAPAGVATADHDPEDAAIEGITAYPTNIVAGVGFDIIAHAPAGSWGRYLINVRG